MLQKTQEQNCNDVLTKSIKNVNPSYCDFLVKECINGNLKNNKKDIEKFLRDKMQLRVGLAKHSQEYWSKRGWSFAESYIKSKEHKQKNCKSIYSQKFWLEKINPLTNTYYTEAEADFERNSRRPIRKEYWIKKGFRESDAAKLAQETKINNNKKGAQTGIDINIRRATSKRCIEYYLLKGYSKEESEILLSNNQKFFSKEICIQKYGEEQGLKIWQNRQIKWKKSLKDSGIYLGVSKTSLKLFVELSKNFPNLQYGNNEQNIICSNKIFSVDCLSIENKKIIEFYGDYWHANPKKFNAESKIKTTSAENIWKKDQERINELEIHGYKVLIVWESEVKHNFKETINKCINFLL